ncbi:fibronectin type III domain-containing protein [Campylobacter mucosalis]|uniref:fibronectin type III domain-containing protein n=1 Tax=Campylobacter mucosalis TaxID=202 RepID=UPI00201663A9|nr:fibronectin type III domain-containing protein [Campylobacter mucosalis]
MKKQNLAILTAFLTIFLAGCASSTPTNQSASLPTINNIKTITDTTEVAFEWQPTNEEKVKGYILYRQNPNDGKFTAVANIKDRFATHYVDTDLAPETTYTYQIRSYSDEAISLEGNSVSATTRPLINSVAFIQAIAGLPNRVKLIWRPHTDASVVSYVIKRANADSENFNQIAEIKGRLNAEYIDSDVKPNKNYKYILYVKNQKGTLSKPSQVVNATTKELP